ncbi:MAG: hypothetical protein Q9222_007129 [Ikaeria aurantiellina]
MIKLYGRNWKFIADNILQLRAPLALKNRYSLLMRRRHRQEQCINSHRRDNASSRTFSGNDPPSPENGVNSSNLLDCRQTHGVTVHTPNSDFPLQFDGHSSNFGEPGDAFPWPSICATSAATAAPLPSAWASPDVLWQHQQLLSSAYENKNNEDNTTPSQYPNNNLPDLESSETPGILTPASSINSPPNLLHSQNSASTNASTTTSTSADGGGGEVEYAVTCQWGKMKTLMNHLVDAAMSETAAWMSEDDRVTVTLRLQPSA